MVLFSGIVFSRIRRLFDKENEHEAVEEQEKSGDKKGKAHAEQIGQDAAKQRAQDTAGRHDPLHGPQAESELFFGSIECHNGQIHRPQPVGKAL